jgi:cob(I)alamin adenosyltransferase
MAIYTKRGDRGETSLFDGSRVGKSNMRIDMLGYLDEVNSFIGLLRANIEEGHQERDFLFKVQSALLDIGAEIANPRKRADEYKDYDVYVKLFEERMDEMEQKLDPLYNFILPGGSIPSSYCHICRTITRKSERLFFELRGDINLNDSIGRFLNRLSDYFFMLARMQNKERGIEDVAWNTTMGLGI